MRLKTFHKIDPACWPAPIPPGLCEVWKSKDYLVQVYSDSICLARLTISTTKMRTGEYLGTLSWETLQGIKNALGFEGLDAVEVYPAQGLEVNDANMRHLFVVGACPLTWGRRGEIVEAAS